MRIHLSTHKYMSTQYTLTLRKLNKYAHAHQSIHKCTQVHTSTQTR